MGMGAPLVFCSQRAGTLNVPQREGQLGLANGALPNGSTVLLLGTPRVYSASGTVLGVSWLTFSLSWGIV